MYLNTIHSENLRTVTGFNVQKLECSTQKPDQSTMFIYIIYVNNNKDNNNNKGQAHVSNQNLKENICYFIVE